MNTEKGQTRQHLRDTSDMKEEKAGCDFTTEESGREIIGQEIAATMADESILTDPAHPLDNTSSSSSDTPSSEDTQLLSKPSLSYIALIAKVLLSSPSQKLNLASIYRAMEEQFPHLGSRGPGWKNSVRHNLSVNDCFVKVSRCEDGRGHYWGVHQAHLRDFQQGNFRLYRKARGRRRKERCDKAAGPGCLAVMETSCFLGRFYESRSFGCVESRCLLQEPREYQMSSLDWTQPRYQPWSFNAGWVQYPSWMRRYYLLPNSYGYRATAGRGHASQPVTSRLDGWEMNEPLLGGMKESCVTPPVHELTFPGCWCTSPAIKELIRPLPYKVNF